MPRPVQLPFELLTVLFEIVGMLSKGLLLRLEVGGMLVNALLVSLEFSRVPSELPMLTFDTGDMLAECVVFRRTTRHTAPLILEKRPEQRCRGVERVSKLIECSQWVAIAMCVVVE